jgi:hypothetical protein
MAKLKFTQGRPDLPWNEPTLVAGGATTDDTAQVYCIDTGGADAVLASGMLAIADNGTKSASQWAGATFNGVLYGRWTNVGADVQLACYTVDVSNSGE